MAISKIPSKKYGYTYQVDIRYKDPFGVTQRHIKSGFRRKELAKSYEASIIDKAHTKESIPIKNSKTINEVYDEYMKLEGSTKYARATIVYYNNTFNKYIRNSIGLSLISLIDRVSLQKFFNDVSSENNYPIVSNIKRTLNATFKYALRAGYRTDNPIKDIVFPNKPANKKEIKTISNEDLQKVFEQILNIPKQNRWDQENLSFRRKSYAVAIYIGRYTGLRISEVLALKKEDFDLDNNTLYVSRRLNYANLKKEEQTVTGRLKTRSSKKRVSINQIFSQNMKKWFSFNPYDNVICDINGNLISPSILQENIRIVSRKTGVKLHFHMLRHTYATELMMAGVNPVVVKELLRHSKVNTTWDIYTHPKREDQRKALDDLYDNIEQKL